MTIDFEKLAVMVVDDNIHMRFLISSILRALKINRICECPDGATALAEIEAFRPDLAIVDWHMEPMNGLELIAKIRQLRDSGACYVPIIMLTGHTEEKRVREARDIGVNEFLAKPVSPKALLVRIVSILEHPRPFIETASYFGPDRRRQDLGPPAGMRDRRVRLESADHDVADPLTPTRKVG